MTNINPINDSTIVPWEQGVRQGGLMNKKVMKENLLSFRHAMEEAEIPFVFIFGTLLGIIREKGFIDYDTDIDVACFSEDHKKILSVIEDLKKQNFYIPNKNKCPLHDHFFIRNGEKIEIWWFDKIGNERIYDNIVRYSEAYFKPLEKMTFCDLSWNIPNNSEKFLELTYGSTWRIPNKNGHYILGQK